jgi:hypothetical protein
VKAGASRDRSIVEDAARVFERSHYYVALKTETTMELSELYQKGRNLIGQKTCGLLMDGKLLSLSKAQKAPIILGWFHIDFLP